MLCTSFEKSNQCGHFQEVYNKSVSTLLCRITDDNQKSGSASHGTAYKSIISNYYTNDPYFGPTPSKPKYASKDQALQRLKSIIKQSKRTSGTGEQILTYLVDIFRLWGKEESV